MSSHMLVACSTISDARTEVRIHGGGCHFDFSTVLFDLLTGGRVALDCRARSAVHLAVSEKVTVRKRMRRNA